MSILSRCEDYATWTLPYIFPASGTYNTELNNGVDSTGAQAVNHLSNKLVMTLFQPHMPFFRLSVADDVLEEYVKLAEDGDEDAQEIIDTLDMALAKAEKQAMRALDFNTYRTEATTAAKNLIITGNALLYHPEKGRTQCYSLKDYVVQRDLSGEVICFITRDQKDFSTFSDDVKEQLRNHNRAKYDKDGCNVKVYTRVKLEDDGRYHMTQYADDVKLDSEGAWPADELPWIILTWNLIRGEDYGRGLVEDYAGAFHSLYVLSNALTDCVGIAADVKFLVNPTSLIDVKELNESPSGSYHTGAEGDVTTIELGKRFDLAMVENAIARLTQQISKAFLLNSSVQRDAERVTAEEIRYVAQELELSHGGIYSRFAIEWQMREAVLALKRIDVKVGKDSIIEPTIITGLDSLSKAGDLEALRLWIGDLALLNELPDDTRAVIDPARYAAYTGIRRGVDYAKIIKSTNQMQAEQQAIQDQQADQLGQEAAVGMAAEAGKQIMKEE